MDIWLEKLIDFGRRVRGDVEDDRTRGSGTISE